MPAKRTQTHALLHALIAASALLLAGSGTALAQDTMSPGDGTISGNSAQSGQPNAADSQPMSDDQPMPEDNSASGDDYGSTNYHTPSQPVENAPTPDASQPEDNNADDEAPGGDIDSDTGMGQRTGPDTPGSYDD